ncbi:MAG: pyruvate formate lyase-activating protein [Clostridia bacterium]|nr:pyruvate formate lyase-activating protein [Clostridia bacterium]MBQ5743080.1 pyruvate formate lyase-activating protein [Clostridia bacterium]
MGKIHSIQSLGTVDGPGIRFVVFFQGCNLRCGCCHNPDTWSLEGGTEISPEEIVSKAERYKSYFGNNGGITLSGGEPLLQPIFAKEIFSLCKERGINTCLDTSGSLLNDAVSSLLDVTDRVLLDIKYSTDEQYLQYVGCDLKTPLKFLELLKEKKIPTTLRQVTIPTLNDDEASIDFLIQLKKENPCVDKIELLPFKKICTVKYQNMGLPFRFESFDTPTAETMKQLQSKLI